MREEKGEEGVEREEQRLGEVDEEEEGEPREGWEKDENAAIDRIAWIADASSEEKLLSDGRRVEGVGGDVDEE